MKKLFYLLTLMIVISSCAINRTNDDIPTVNFSKLNTLNLKKFGIDTINIEIVDKRSPSYLKNSNELVEKVNDIYTYIIQVNKTTVIKSSSNSLKIEIKDLTDSETNKTKEECIKLEYSGKFSDGVWLEGSSFGCFKYTNRVFNFSLGGNISKSYQLAINSSIKSIQKKLDDLYKRK